MLIDKNIGIYIIVNTINGKFYIGSSSDIQQRFYNHKSKLLNNKHINLHFQNSVNKYGFENFKFEILANCPLENLDSLEQWYVDNLKPQYNIRKFVESNRGIILKEEHKEKISNSMKGKFCKPVLQYTKEGEFVKEWESLTEASNSGYCHGKISLCCNDKRNFHKGFIWKFKNKI
jgi:group I intron endonuclease